MPWSRYERALGTAIGCSILLLWGCADADGPAGPVGLTDPSADPRAMKGAPLSVAPSELAFVLPPGGSATLTATVQFTGPISATSTDDACAAASPLSVPAFKPAGSSVYVATFTVTAAGVGTCSITVTDKRGRSVVVPVVIDAPPPPRIIFVSDRDGNPELYAMAPDGSGIMRLTNTSDPEGAPRLSADGRRLLFYRAVAGEPHVFLANSDGSDEVRIPELDGISEFALSPDGSQIAFRGRPDGTPRIGVLDVASRQVAFVSPLDLVTVNEPAFIPGGSGIRVAFTSFSILWTMNPDGSDPVVVTDLDDWVHTATRLAVSQDGLLIAFECQPETHVLDVCVMQPDGTAKVRLTADPVTDANPIISPDGRIVFTRRDPVTFDTDIWAINPDGSELVHLLDSPLGFEFTR